MVPGIWDLRIARMDKIVGKTPLAESEEEAPKTAPPLRMIAWEVTRSCNLNCIHCRAAAQRGPYPGELGTEEALRLIDEIVSFSQPVVILTGGEPLLRPDIYDLARY